jgi:aryl-alcohol dehydrogenase-like predicted oxidoreductase
MQKKQLGNSDLNITSVGFGAWAIGGGGWEFGWGPQDDNISIEAIHRALEIGINWIDTAAVYGCGHSEEVVAKALYKWGGKRPDVFTKCILRWDDDGKIFQNYTPKSLRQECEDSLRRLNTDVIDLYQIHWPPAENETLIDAAWEMMARLKEEGKVRWIGVSNFNIEQMKRAQTICPITSLQPPYSLINRNIEAEILPYCMEQNIGVIVYSPMASGLLTGSMTRERIKNLPDDDWRLNWDEFKELKITKNLELAEKLKEIGKTQNRTAGEIAISWTLKHPAVTGAIVGVRSAEQVDGVMKAGEFELNDDEVNALETHFSLD